MLLSIPLKNTCRLQWTPTLLEYISIMYAEDAKKYEEDCKILDSLRNRSLFQPFDAPFALEDLSIYYNQLTFLGSRFPAHINLNIGWFSIFQPQDKPEIMTNLNYEKACVLFRIAGVYSELGCLQSWISTEGTRKSCHLFQNAAGCLSFVKSDLLSDFQAKSHQDFDMIDAFIALMMAQAHECVWKKAIMEHMKHGTVARLAMKVSDLYNTFLFNISSNIPTTWKVYADTKSKYFKAVAHYQKANEAISSGRYGEEIARLHIAESFLANIKSQDSLLLHKSFLDQITTLDQAIQQDLLRAEKDNDIVYMETVPESNQLAPILRSDMVKPIIPSFISDSSYWLTLPDRPNDDCFIRRPLFENLVPFAVHQAASIYSDKKDYIVKVEIGKKIHELDAIYQKFLEDHNLPYALDSIDTLPETLRNYAEEVQHEGGMQSLQDMLQNVQKMSLKAIDLINEGFNALEKENEYNVTLSKQYGKLWSRPSSQTLSQNLLTLGSKYYDTVQAAQKADHIVQAKINNWGKAISMLSKPESEIIQHLPNIKPNEEYDDDYTTMKILLTHLRDKLQLLEKTFQERKNLQNEMVEYAKQDDISQALLTKANELTNGSFLVKLEPEQFSTEFDKHSQAYQPFQTKIQVNTDHQADIINTMIGLLNQFSFIKENNNVLKKREKAIVNLESAFTRFKEIRTNLVEGIKFYSHYIDILSQFRNECVSFELSRRLEAIDIVGNTNHAPMLL
ncbi:BRO1-like domain-containing protein [Cokeromyces recurvatus]|uniref:BRO1-like domain-containing protein n=1 Tax=Cokeromyces recurvatus TaxID=90255 RepID=UPI00221EEC30|nr:BRO1-like domain-containing protein [Cokeromyces recurvatus]KAI7900451.1 BRO1-like domain-containing protein [Cokeromyces recurvatus]